MKVQANQQFSLYKAGEIVKHPNLKLPFEYSNIYATGTGVFKQWNIIVYLSPLESFN